MTAGWQPADLDRMGGAEELEVASFRADGTLRPYVPIWGVRVGEQLFVRSAYGADNPWFRRAVTSGTGRVRAGGIERQVRFGTAADADHRAIDAAHHTKYDRYGPQIVGTVTGPSAPSTTLRLLPD